MLNDWVFERDAFLKFISSVWILIINNPVVPIWMRNQSRVHGRTPLPGSAVESLMWMLLNACIRICGCIDTDHVLVLCPIVFVFSNISYPERMGLWSGGVSASYCTSTWDETQYKWREYNERQSGN